MTAPPDAAIIAGARVLAGDALPTADHHWQAANVWHAMQAHQWRPIETAPRDGSVIVTAPLGDRRVVVGEAHFYTDDDYPERSAWWWANTGPGNYAEEAIEPPPTHWQPLPPPPKSEENTDAA